METKNDVIIPEFTAGGYNFLSLVEFFDQVTPPEEIKEMLEKVRADYLEYSVYAAAEQMEGVFLDLVEFQRRHYALLQIIEQLGKIKQVDVVR